MSNHDLISRAALIKAVEQKHFAISDNTHPYEAIRIQGKYFREVVDSQPVVDAVEIVRCKDCKHLQYQDEEDDRGDCDIHDTWFTRTPESFCCYGERREE